MRNLKNIKCSVVRLKRPGLPLTATTWDTANDSLICAFGPSENEAAVELRRFSSGPHADDEGTLIASWDAPCPSPELAHDKILSLQHFSENLTTCLVFAGGDTVVVREEPFQDQDPVEIIGSVDAGIAAAAWSPDEELLAIVTSANTLLFMTKTFESIVTVSFSPDDSKVSNHVSVGWGKAETQFKGKRAKALRDPTVPEHVDEGLLSERDNGQVYVSWRGDGAFIAVNSIEDCKRRMIRVYSREGIIESVSEPVDYLEGPISWRPAGNIIAGVQRLEAKTQVVFFERNGLRHGEFDLRILQKDNNEAEDQEKRGQSIIVALEWNNDSSILAVCFKDKVQLWTMGNYHYYLKQEIFALVTYDGGESQAAHDATKRFLNVRWHPERPLRIAAYDFDGFQQMDYAFRVCCSPTHPPNDIGAVAVTDGKTLKLTPLGRANIPPPMAFHELNLPHEVQDVAFNASGNSVAILMKDSFAVYNCDWSTKPAVLQVQKQNIVRCISRQIVFEKNGDPVILVHDYDSHKDEILSGAKDGSEDKNPMAIDTATVTSLVSSLPSRNLFVHAADGRLLSCAGSAWSESDLSRSQNIHVPPSIIHVEVVTFNEETIAFGLTPGGALYANERLLTRFCTSMAVTTSHLIFTTNQNLLKFVHLVSAGDLKIPLDTEQTDERCRSIERGARIVTVIPSAYSVVLQMPRGNLETIYPRALVLAGIRRSIAASDWREAFMACRNQRVDMNILHDHDSEHFFASIPAFIQQVKKAEHIDLFLSSLRDEDVSQTMYRDTLRRQTGTNGVNNGQIDSESHAPQFADAPKSSKVNAVCDRFLSHLTARSKPTSQTLRNIITAHVCKQPPDIEAGLSVVAALQAAEPESELAERAAEHICFLADPNTLYSSALGLYNIHLTVLIAQQSQKDPREFLPYLQSLLEMTDLKRKFTIDNDLGRHSKALKHLHGMGLDAFDELKRYMQRHELYNEAIELYRYQPEQSNALTELYADFLAGRNRFAEAGLAYDFLGRHSSASEAYRQAGMWREALSSAMLAEPPTSSAENVEVLARELAASCEEAKDFLSAAVIYKDYLDDAETAVKTYCKAHNIAEAIRLVGLSRRPEWLESIVDPGVVEGTASMTEMLGEMREQLRNQVPRLRELRQRKSLNPLAFYDGGGAGDGADVPDNISLAGTDASTTGGTFMTRYTGRTEGTLHTQASRRTHKNRRREERKRARGKKGTVYEEEYLLNSIRRLMERVNDVGGDATNLVEGLVRRGMRERARHLQELMGGVVDGCRGVVAEVFRVEEGKRAEGEGREGGEGAEGLGDRPLGGDGVLWDSLEGARRKTEAPVVKEFHRLALLAP